MRMRKTIRTMMLMICLALIASLSVNAATAKTKNPAAYVKITNNKPYLYDKETNKKVTGITGVSEYPKGSGYYYYFRFKSGLIFADTRFTRKKQTEIYCANKEGILLTGWQTVSGKRYYFDKKTCKAVTGWQKIGKQYFYFNKKGEKVTGWLKWNNNMYYLNPKAGGARTVGLKKIGTKRYYFNTGGQLMKGWITYNGKTYYADAKTYTLATGLQKIDGKIYYFDKYGVVQIGWQTISGKKYYLRSATNPKGQAASGWVDLDGYKYYFDTTSCVMQTGWLTQNGKKCYLNPGTGRMTTGKASIDGKTYDFGTSGWIQAGPQIVYKSGMNINNSAEQTGTWFARVNRNTCVITLYRGSLSNPVASLICSVGLNGATPTGDFSIPGTKYRWHELFGSVYGQYCTVVTGNILFHSVYYYTYGNNNTLSVEQYNKLGTPASAGCIRVTVSGAKYIYDNLPGGAKVTIFDGTSADDPLGKPTYVKATTTHDPTDPN